MDLVDADLAALQQQADTPSNQVMKATRPTVSKDPTVLYGAVYQAAAVTVVTGLLLALLLCFTVDRRLRRRSRRAGRAAPVQVATAGRRIRRIGRSLSPVAAHEAVDVNDVDNGDEVVTSRQGSGDQPPGAMDEWTDEQQAGLRLHEREKPNRPDEQDEPAQGLGQLHLPLEAHGSADAARTGAKPAKVSSGPSVRVAGPSRRHRNRMARRAAQTAARQTEAPKGSGQPRAGSLAG